MKNIKYGHFYSLVAILICVTLGGIVIALYNGYSQAVKSIMQQHNKRQVVIAEQIARRARHHFQHITIHLDILSANQAIKRFDPLLVGELVKQELTYLDHFDVNNIGLLDKDGIMRFNAAASQLIGKDFSFRPDFQNARDANNADITVELINFQGVQAGVQGLSVAKPVFTESDEFNGMVFFSVRLNTLFKLPDSDRQGSDDYWLISNGEQVLLGPTSKPNEPITDIPQVNQGLLAFLQENKGAKSFTGELIHNEVEVAAGSSVKILTMTMDIIASIPIARMNILSSRFSQYFASGILMIFLGLLGTYFLLFHWYVQLRSQVKRRKKAEVELQEAHDLLEKRVGKRTEELATVNEQLCQEMEQRRAATEDVRQKNEFLNHVMKSLTIPFLVINVHDYTVKMANAAANFGPLTGLETCHQLTHRNAKPCAPEERPCTIAEIKRTNAPVVLEHLHYNQDGQAMNVEVHGYPIDNEDGSFDEIIEYSLDVTARKKHEEELLKSRNLKSIGRLASGIAHEINNPLTNASLNLQMLLRSHSKYSHQEGCHKRLKNVERNVEKAANIAKELLLFSRQQETEGILVNINKLIDGALVLLKYKIQGIFVQKNLPPVPEVIGDPVKIEQVFLNLFNNALEAMGKSGTLTINCSEAENHVVVDIIDTGPGIPAAYIDKIFEPFFSTKNIGKGTGLGLSICYGIISQHHGDMKISSIEHEGARITIKLPIAEVIL